jgi:predicted lipoprotein with Yx(FWY)xxD motif
MRLTTKTLLPALAISLMLAACGSSSKGSTTPSPSASSTSASTSASTTSTGASAQAVKAASNAQLRATVLVDANGMTLYHLTGEQDGQFICTSAECEKNWPPVAASAMSESVAGLGTVKRPDGMEQLTYKGEPLYTFAGDKAPGEANGQGIKDVGTWMAVTTGASSSAASGASQSSESASGAGERY